MLRSATRRSSVPASWFGGEGSVGFNWVVFHRVDSEFPVLWNLDGVPNHTYFDLPPPMWIADPIAETGKADTSARVDLPHDRLAHRGRSDRPSPRLPPPHLRFRFWRMLAGVGGNQHPSM